MVGHLRDADLGEDHGDAGSFAERVDGELVEALRIVMPHVRHDAAGRPARSTESASIASWSRPSTRTASQPSSAKRCSIPPGQWWSRSGCRSRRRQRAEPDAPRVLHGFPVLPSSSSPSPTRQYDAPAGERAADCDRQPVAERAAADLDAGHEHAVGMVPSGESNVPNPSSSLDRDDAFGGEHRVVRGRAVALREQEAVVVGGRGRRAPRARRASRASSSRASRRRSGGSAAPAGPRSRAARDRHARTIELQLLFKSSASRSLDRRAVPAQRRLAVGTPLLRAAGADRGGAERGQSAAVSGRDASPGRARPGGQGGRHPPRPDPARARHAARRPPADEARLGAPVGGWRRELDERIGPSRRSAHASHLHRLRLPVAADVRSAQPGRRSRSTRRRRALLA